MKTKRILPFCYLFLLVILITGISGGSQPVFGQTAVPDYPVYIYFFWGEGCPHCAAAKPFFESLPGKYPSVVLNTYEVYYEESNQQLFINMAQKYGLEQLAVPTFFLGPYYLQGYSEEAAPSIEAAVVQCIENGCIDPAEGVAGFPTKIPPAIKPSLAATSSITPLPTYTPVSETAAPESTQIAAINPVAQNDPPRALNQSQTLDLPIVGSIDLSLQSITLTTAIIAFVDGFNPCSLWVLSMLLALTLHTGSRKKVLLIGLIFLTVTAAIYALFIAGLFSVLKVTSFLGWIQVLVALVALFFALVNIKDYFWYKEGLSFTIADDKKAGIFKRIRAVLDASQSFWGLASATIILAVGVSMVEFSCTAGFPVLWVNLLNTQNISGISFVLLLLLYMLIYQLDELLIFGSALVSFKASRLEEKHGRVLKLIGGMLMLTLSVVMLINPDWMNNLTSTFIIFGVAFLSTILVIFFHRILLPKFGIRIGTGSEN